MTDSVLTPRQVDGYAEAASLGILPRVPDLPPELPRETAQRAFLHWLVTIGLGAVAWVVVVSLARRPLGHALPIAGPILLMLGAVLVFLVVVLRGRERVGRVFLSELMAGYTTLPLTTGAFWGVNRRRNVNYAEPWDFRGVWVLEPDGRVRTAPELGVDPPGLYPSPELPGRLQVWTGTVWARKFVLPPQVFLRR